MEFHGKVLIVLQQVPQPSATCTRVRGTLPYIHRCLKLCTWRLQTSQHTDFSFGLGPRRKDCTAKEGTKDDQEQTHIFGLSSGIARGYVVSYHHTLQRTVRTLHSPSLSYNSYIHNVVHLVHLKFREASSWTKACLGKVCETMKPLKSSAPSVSHVLEALNCRHWKLRASRSHLTKPDVPAIVNQNMRQIIFTESRLMKSIHRVDNPSRLSRSHLGGSEIHFAIRRWLMQRWHRWQESIFKLWDEIKTTQFFLFGDLMQLYVGIRWAKLWPFC